MRDYEIMIRSMSAAMLTQMQANDSRGYGFRDHIILNEPIPAEMFVELRQCIDRLEAVATDGEKNNPSLVEQRLMIREYAADVANMAMLIALNTGSLPASPGDVE